MLCMEHWMSRALEPTCREQVPSKSTEVEVKNKTYLAQENSLIWIQTSGYHFVNSWAINQLTLAIIDVFAQLQRCQII